MYELSDKANIEYAVGQSMHHHEKAEERRRARAASGEIDKERYQRELEIALNESVKSEAARQRSQQWQQQDAAATPPAAPVTFEDRQRELECVNQLRGLGFTDVENILAAARRARGDPGRAVEIMLEMQEKEANSWETVGSARGGDYGRFS